MAGGVIALNELHKINTQAYTYMDQPRWPTASSARGQRMERIQHDNNNNFRQKQSKPAKHMTETITNSTKDQHPTAA